jgi:hypothetical protein
VVRAARILGLTALGLLGAYLAVLTVQMVLLANLWSDGREFDDQFWLATTLAGIVGTLCALDLLALLMAVRGRRLLAQYRQERDDWREVRAAQGGLLRRR